MSDKNMSARWILAQDYEKNVWLQDRERVLSQEYIDSKEKYARGILNWLNKFAIISDETKILQIGSAGEGAIFFFDIGDRYAIDPLANFYSKEFGEIIDKRVTFLEGVGEKLPWGDNFFDIVIIFNVLDHVDSPCDVLDEMHRVLKNGGITYIGVHIFSWPGLLYRNIREMLHKIKLTGFDQGHPHSFSAYRLEKMINNYFNVINTNHDDKMHLGDLKGFAKFKKYLVGHRMYRFIVEKHE